MTHATELTWGYEPSIDELLNSDLTRLAIKSAKVPQSHVEALTQQAAESVRGNRAGKGR